MPPQYTNLPNNLRQMIVDRMDPRTAAAAKMTSKDFGRFVAGERRRFVDPRDPKAINLASRWGTLREQRASARNNNRNIFKKKHDPKSRNLPNIQEKRLVANALDQYWNRRFNNRSSTASLRRMNRLLSTGTHEDLSGTVNRFVILGLQSGMDRADFTKLLNKFKARADPTSTASMFASGNDLRFLHKLNVPIGGLGVKRYLTSDDRLSNTAAQDLSFRLTHGHANANWIVSMLTKTMNLDTMARLGKDLEPYYRRAHRSRLFKLIVQALQKAETLTGANNSNQTATTIVDAIAPVARAVKQTRRGQAVLDDMLALLSDQDPIRRHIPSLKALCIAGANPFAMTSTPPRKPVIPVPHKEALTVFLNHASPDHLADSRAAAAAWWADASIQDMLYHRSNNIPVINTLANYAPIRGMYHAALDKMHEYPYQVAGLLDALKARFGAVSDPNIKRRMAELRTHYINSYNSNTGSSGSSGPPKRRRTS